MIEEKIIIKWFKARFMKDPDSDINYYLQWVDRFDKGLSYAISLMDKKSKQKFLSVLANEINDSIELTE